jgi:hypothetical protein
MAKSLQKKPNPCEYSATEVQHHKLHGSVNTVRLGDQSTGFD